MAKIDYIQPDFYHFSEDSILLADFVEKRIKDLSEITLLDVCAGSGVVGLELAQKIPTFKKIIFLEIQNEYKLFLLKNIKTFLPAHIPYEIHIEDYNHFDIKEKVEVIVCNPPYYFLDSGKISPNPQKAKSRAFSEGDFKNLFSFFSRGLKAHGNAYFCGPKRWEAFQDQYSFSILEEREHINLYEFTCPLLSSL